MGTVDGVNALLGLKDLRTGLTLMDFLKAAHRPQATLIFSGHSLGGALAPVLALVLFNPFGGPLKQADWRSVLNYPTAGPTPGNQQLAQFFASAFPMTPARPEADSYRVWNANIWITLDVIPHAWEISMLDEIPTLYKLSDELRLQVRAEIAIAKALSNEGAKAGGPYTMLPNQKVTRPYVDPILGDMQAFDAELLYQHISAYNILLNVESLISSPAAPSPISQAAKSGSPA
jgi:acetyl esterase/lipase